MLSHLVKYSLLSIVFTLMINTSVIAAKNKVETTHLQFETYQITVPFNVSQPILAIDVVDNGELATDELIVIGEDSQHQAWLAVYTFEQVNKAFVLLDKIRLEKKYFAYDVGENSQKLYLLSKNEIVYLQYNADRHINAAPLFSFYHQQKIGSIFIIEESSFITEKNFIQDVNKDGLDDIILPDFNHVNLWLSSPDSTELYAQSIAISTNTELRQNSVSFSPKKLFFGDFDLDKHQDIAWIEQGSIHYFSQLTSGRFATTSTTISLNNNIHGLNWWQIREADGDSLDQSQLAHRAVEEIKDINGDGLIDVVVRFTQSSGVLDRTNEYEAYYGYELVEDKQRKLAYLATPTTVIKADGTLTGLTIVDVNNDEKLEVLLSSFELSLGNIIGALISGGIDQNVLLFSLDNQDIYDDDAMVTKTVELSFSLSKGRSGEPVVMLVDVNGDELLDLVLSDDDTQLNIYMGQKSKRLFQRKAIKKKLSLPKNGALFSHHDINQDGKEDFLMHYGRLDPVEMANKITILLAL